MEQLNKVELVGVVGNVRVQTHEGQKIARIGLATNYCYREPDGVVVIETTWHMVILCEGKGICDLTQLTKGTSLHVIGRLRNQEYSDQAGNRHLSFDVIASSAEIIELERGDRLHVEEHPDLRFTVENVPSE